MTSHKIINTGRKDFRLGLRCNFVIKFRFEPHCSPLTKKSVGFGVGVRLKNLILKFIASLKFNSFGGYVV